jgi:hypothetical protein
MLGMTQKNALIEGVFEIEMNDFNSSASPALDKQVL